MHEGLGWGGWVLWTLFMVALWALVIMAVIWLARSLSGRRTTMAAPGGAAVWRGSGPGGMSGPSSTASAEQILAERFAHGQIDENEYRSRLGVLRGDQTTVAQGPPPPAAPPQAPPPTTPPASTD